MKRSEMIKIIMDTFEFEGRGNQMREKDASSILDAMEEAGMFPPYDASVDDEANGHEWEKE